jgi:flagellar M-ring protein FliF
MAFDESVAGPLVAPGLLDRVSLDLGRVLQTLVLAAAALFIAFGLLRPLLRRPAEDLAVPAASIALARQPEDAQAAGALPLAAPEAGTPERNAPGLPPAAAAAASAGAAGAAAALPAPALPLAEGAELPLDPVERLRRLIEEREEETVEILRSWMEEDEGVRP